MDVCLAGQNRLADRSVQRGQRAIKAGVYTGKREFDFSVSAPDNRKIL